MRTTALNAFEHQEVPFERLVEELQVPRDQSRTPIFQHLFVLQNTPASTAKMGEVRVSDFEVDPGIARYDVTLNLAESAQGLSGWIEYSTELYDEGTARRMVTHLETLLRGIIANPGKRIAQLPILPESEYRQIVLEWNQTQTPFPHQLIHQLIECQVERTPLRTAVVFQDEQLTYRELNSRADEWAEILRAHGVKADTRVGLCVERSIDMIVALLAILKSGGAYVPLDPHYPQDRLNFMLEDSGALLLLTQEKFRSRFPNKPTLCLDSRSADVPVRSNSNQPNATAQTPSQSPASPSPQGRGPG